MLSVEDSRHLGGRGAGFGHRPRSRGAHVKIYPRSADVLVIAVEGEIDASNAAGVGLQLHAALATIRPLIVDMTDVEFLGAAGMLHLLAFGKACANCGLPWTLVTSRCVWSTAPPCSGVLGACAARATWAVLQR